MLATLLPALFLCPDHPARMVDLDAPAACDEITRLLAGYPGVPPSGK